MTVHAGDRPQKCERSHSRATLHCARCGAAFEGLRSWARFCSNRCRSAAGRAQHRIQSRSLPARDGGLDPARWPYFLGR